MLVSGYNNIILLPNCTLLYYVFSGPLSLCAYVPEIKFNNNNNTTAHVRLTLYNYDVGPILCVPTVTESPPAHNCKQLTIIFRTKA